MTTNTYAEMSQQYGETKARANVRMLTAGFAIGTDRVGSDTGNDAFVFLADESLTAWELGRRVADAS